MSVIATRQQRKVLEKANKQFPGHLLKIPTEVWSGMTTLLSTAIEVWRSRDFLVQVHSDTNEGVERLSICRTALSGDRWMDGIRWDDIQRLKRECGRGDKFAVEIYPSDEHVVNVANMRHIWVLDKPPVYAWMRTKG